MKKKKFIKVLIWVASLSFVAFVGYFTYFSVAKRSIELKQKIDAAINTEITCQFGLYCHLPTPEGFLHIQYAGLIRPFTFSVIQSRGHISHPLYYSIFKDIVPLIRVSDKGDLSTHYFRVIKLEETSVTFKYSEEAKLNLL